MEHFTGVKPLYLPTLASYVTARYSGGGARRRGKPFLMWRSHHELGRSLLAELVAAAPDVAVAALDKASCLPPPPAAPRPAAYLPSTLPSEQAYPGGAGRGGYQYGDLARHPGIVVVPYTKSTMSFFELYRMNIPLFFPSIELLTRCAPPRSRR